MHIKRGLLLSGASLTAVFLAWSNAVWAQNATAFSGKVSSPAETAMEGVIVSAKKDGTNITVSVVSDDKGSFNFPAGRLSAGHYKLSIRAVGYDLQSPKEIDIPAGGGAKADVKLDTTKNLEMQLSNAEWIISAPGTDKEKNFMGHCVGCHSLQRPMFSRYTAEELPAVFKRMTQYSSGSTPIHFQLLQVDGERIREREDNPDIVNGGAEFLAKINLSSGSRTYPLKTLPRPTGRATRVIYTEYDLPRKEAEPHDVVITADGHAWYSDFGSAFAGELDPETGKVTDYPLPILKPKSPKGTLQIALDPWGNLWVGMMMQAGLAKIDPKTKQITAYSLPEEGQSNSAYLSMVAPQHADVDGKVWTSEQHSRVLWRIDVNTGKWERMGTATTADDKKISGYGLPTDLQNNPYLLAYQDTRIGWVDAKTNTAKIWTIPFGKTKPRRGRVDHENRLWIGMYGSNGIGVFDPKTEQFTEYRAPTPWSAPYDVERAKNGDVWSGSMLNDHITRLDPKTGAFTEYLMPRFSNIRRIFVDNNASRPTLWLGNNHGASIAKLEVLD
jgi:virginiamycin B lyase